MNEFEIQWNSYTSKEKGEVNWINNFYYLIEYEGIIYTYKDKEIVKCNSQEIKETNFIKNGFKNIEIITEELWNSTFKNKDKIKILLYTYKRDTPFKIIYNCNEFDLVKWLKENSCKLLMYTQDTEKTQAQMVYNTEPFRPIDKLKENNDGKFNVIMKKE